MNDAILGMAVLWIRGRVRHLIEVLSSVFLCLLQYIPVAGPWRGLMVFPLAYYLFEFFWSFPEFREQQFHLLLFEPKLIFGRVIALAGLAIFLAASIQMLLMRGRGLLVSGLYSVVRHPQYLGIIIMTLGLTTMSIQWLGWSLNIVLAWIIEVLGYVLLAYYEELHLLNTFEKEYQKYRQKIPFIFPLNQDIMPEPILTLIITLIIAFMLTIL